MCISSVIYTKFYKNGRGFRSARILSSLLYVRRKKLGTGRKIALPFEIGLQYWDSPGYIGNRFMQLALILYPLKNWSGGAIWNRDLFGRYPQVQT